MRDEVGKTGRASIASLRARALAAWAAGVDGIEMFNHFDPASPLWRELGDPALLRTLPKIYFASVQGASASRSYYPAQGHMALPVLTPDAPESFAPGSTRTYELYVGDDLRTSTRLRARLALRVANPAGRPPHVSLGTAPLTLSVRGAEGWSAEIDSARVTAGLHRVTVTATDAFRLDDLILHVESR